MTELGRILKIIRINNGEVLKAMSDKLGVTSSYLSAVENGKRPMPEEWLNELKLKYNLSNDTTIEIQHAASALIKKIKLDLDNVTEEKRDVALVFARSFDNMDENTAREIKRLLLKEEG